LSGFKQLGGYISEYLAPVIGTVLGGAFNIVGKIASGVITVVGGVVKAINAVIGTAIDGINALIKAYNAIPLLPNIPTVSKPTLTSPNVSTPSMPKISTSLPSIPSISTTTSTGSSGSRWRIRMVAEAESQQLPNLLQVYLLSLLEPPELIQILWLESWLHLGRLTTST
jgi:hypothetical protein